MRHEGCANHLASMAVVGVCRPLSLGRLRGFFAAVAPPPPPSTPSPLLLHGLGACSSGGCRARVPPRAAAGGVLAWAGCGLYAASQGSREPASWGEREGGGGRRVSGVRFVCLPRLCAANCVPVRPFIPSAASPRPAAARDVWWGGGAGGDCGCTAADPSSGTRARALPRAPTVTLTSVRCSAAASHRLPPPAPHRRCRVDRPCLGSQAPGLWWAVRAGWASWTRRRGTRLCIWPSWPSRPSAMTVRLSLTRMDAD